MTEATERRESGRRASLGVTKDNSADHASVGGDSSGSGGNKIYGSKQQRRQRQRRWRRQRRGRQSPALETQVSVNALVSSESSARVGPRGVVFVHRSAERLPQHMHLNLHGLHANRTLHATWRGCGCRLVYSDHSQVAAIAKYSEGGSIRRSIESDSMGHVYMVVGEETTRRISISYCYYLHISFINSGRLTKPPVLGANRSPNEISQYDGERGVPRRVDPPIWRSWNLCWMDVESLVIVHRWRCWMDVAIVHRWRCWMDVEISLVIVHRWWWWMDVDISVTVDVRVACTRSCPCQ